MNKRNLVEVANEILYECIQNATPEEVKSPTFISLISCCRALISSLDAANKAQEKTQEVLAAVKISVEKLSESWKQIVPSSHPR